MDVEDAARLMAQRQVRRLPVVENNRLVGMLSLGDIAVKHGDEGVSGEALDKASPARATRGSRRRAS
jgi:predicted transcriptional regulator